MERQPEPGTAPAADLLAAARFGIPELLDPQVRRPRLEHLLDRATGVPLVLVSAPAGTGKTSLVAGWLRSARAETGLIGWITFEDDDTRFWGFVSDCLARLGIEVPSRSGDAAADTLLGPRRLAALADAVAAAPMPVTLVLDGYEIVSAELAREIDLLLRHTFGHLRLVIVGRVDPVLPLYRYRLADRLREIRVADLAFTDEEAGQLLGGLGLTLRPESVHALNQRTKGWAAGLRFAGRVLKDRDDAETSVATVLSQAGDINEYLVGEVLDTQHADVRRLLLRTCVPDILWPELAEELAGPHAGHALRELTRSNVFIEPVPDRPGGYRYYPFFRDLLRAQLAYEDPEALSELHRTVARVFLRHGLVDQAIAHLAAIGQWDQVARHLVDAHLVGRLLLEVPNGPLASVAARLPDELEEPEACVVRAAVALAETDTFAAAVELSRAREATRDGDPAAPAGALAMSLTVLEALHARSDADAATALHLALEAELATNPPRASSPAVRESALPGLASLALGIARLRHGELEAAREALIAALGCVHAAAYEPFRAECLGYIALADALDGQLGRAQRTAIDSCALAADDRSASGDRAPTAHVALARVALERYDLEEARRHIDTALTCRVLAQDPVSRSVAAGVLAALDRAGGELRPALARLETTASGAVRSDPWLGRHLSVEAARLSIASGEAERAVATLEPFPHQDDPEIAVVRAAAYAEQGDYDAVQECLSGVRAGGAPLRARVAALFVEGVCEARQSPPVRSRDLLSRSLRLAASEGLRRPFREAGPRARRVLNADPRLLLENGWLDRSTQGTSPSPDPEVVEPLTARELEVLRHLEELLTTEEIAEKMFVSVNTIRTHVRSILRKLGVSRRNAAVRKARMLGLVGQ